MKKMVFPFFCFAALTASAQMEVVDVETMTTYNTRITEYRGDPAIILDDSRVIPTSQDAYDAVHNNAFGKWKLYCGPVQRGEIDVPNFGLVGVRACLNTNNVPCMLVRSKEESDY